MRNALNDRSAEHDVAGITARICTTLITRNSSRAGQPCTVPCECNWLYQAGKYLSLQKTKTWKLLLKLALPKFLLLPKKSELPKIWGGCSPPSPPRPVRLCHLVYMETIFTLGCTCEIVVTRYIESIHVSSELLVA